MNNWHYDFLHLAFIPSIFPTTPRFLALAVGCLKLRFLQLLIQADFVLNFADFLPKNSALILSLTDSS